MTPKRFNGKALYQPSGKAAEYSPWACNFFTGCSNDCEYCYCKRGVMSHVWSTTPRLKKCFKDKDHAYAVFYKELIDNLETLKKTGIMFSFTTDPLLPETKYLTFYAVQAANELGVPVKILTKRADFIDYVEFLWFDKSLTAFGFTLTGFDRKEPNASRTRERIETMRELHKMGFKTFASIEPVINPIRSHRLIEETLEFCDYYMIGLISGKGKNFYDHDQMMYFLGWLTGKSLSGHKIYLKDSFLKYFNLDRSGLKGNFVNSDYNIFNDQNYESDKNSIDSSC